jgi:hypothetical protein
MFRSPGIPLEARFIVIDILLQNQHLNDMEHEEVYADMNKMFFVMKK